MALPTLRMNRSRATLMRPTMADSGSVFQASRMGGIGQPGQPARPMQRPGQTAMPMGGARIGHSSPGLGMPQTDQRGLPIPGTQPGVGNAGAGPGMHLGSSPFGRGGLGAPTGHNFPGNALAGLPQTQAYTGVGQTGPVPTIHSSYDAPDSTRGYSAAGPYGQGVGYFGRGNMVAKSKPYPTLSVDDGQPHGETDNTGMDSPDLLPAGYGNTGASFASRMGAAGQISNQGPLGSGLLASEYDPSGVQFPFEQGPGHRRRYSQDPHHGSPPPSGQTGTQQQGLDGSQGDQGTPPVWQSAVDAGNQAQQQGQAASQGQGGDPVSTSAAASAAQGDDYVTGGQTSPAGAQGQQDLGHGYAEFPGSVDASNFSPDDRRWLDYLRANGYDVSNEGGHMFIRMGYGGNGDSQTYHGSFQDQNGQGDWTDKVKELWKHYQGDRKSEDDAKKHQDEMDRMHQLFGMIPDAPQIGDDQLNAMISANHKQAVLDQATQMRAALAGAARGRMGVNAMAGMIGENANRFAAQQQAAAAQQRFQVASTNLESQRQRFAGAIQMVQQYLQGEQDAAARAQAQDYMRQLLEHKAQIEMQMQQQQIEAQNSGFWNTARNIANLGQGAVGIAGGITKIALAPETGGASLL